MQSSKTGFKIKGGNVLTPIKQEYSFKFQLLIMQLIY